MAGKDKVLLLLPSGLFAAIAIGAFVASQMLREWTKDDGHKQKFEAFVTNVQNGNLQLTTDQWIDGMRRENRLAESYREAGASTLTMFRTIFWASLAGVALQVAVVYSVLKKSRKALLEQPPNEKATVPAANG